MNSRTNKQKGFFAVAAILLMIGGGALLTWTINGLYHTLAPFGVLSLALLSVFIYIAGGVLSGQLVNRTYNCHGNNNNNGILLALLLIAGGLLMLCFNIGALNPVWRGFFFSWPMLLFVFGAIFFCRRRFILGIILAAPAIFFLMERTSEVYPEGLRFDHAAMFWPILYIIFGIILLLGIVLRPKRFRYGHRYHRNGEKQPMSDSDINENIDGRINYKVSFSGIEQVILDPVFRGGTIDVTLGGVELDLRRTSLEEGDTFLEIHTMMGGVEITAPDNWEIEIRSNGFIGGTADSRVKTTEKDRTRKLIIIAKCTLGGIDIK